MVGTKPTCLPCWRRAVIRRCVSGMSRRTSIRTSPPPQGLDLRSPSADLLLPAPVLCLLEPKRVFGARKCTGLHLLTVLREGGRNGPLEIGVALDELGREVIEETQEVVRDQELAVTRGPCTDPDGGNPELPGDHLRHPPGNPLEDQRKNAGLLEQQCILEQALRGGGGPG